MPPSADLWSHKRSQPEHLRPAGLLQASPPWRKRAEHERLMAEIEALRAEVEDTELAPESDSESNPEPPHGPTAKEQLLN